MGSKSCWRLTEPHRPHHLIFFLRCAPVALSGWQGRLELWFSGTRSSGLDGSLLFRLIPLNGIPRSPPHSGQVGRWWGPETPKSQTLRPLGRGPGWRSDCLNERLNSVAWQWTSARHLECNTWPVSDRFWYTDVGVWSCSGISFVLSHGTSDCISHISWTCGSMRFEMPVFHITCIERTQEFPKRPPHGGTSLATAEVITLTHSCCQCTFCYFLHL